MCCPNGPEDPVCLSHSIYKGDKNAPFGLKNGAGKFRDINNPRKKVNRYDLKLRI